ncbi:conserved Plasmodium protein, unknown function [Plasmodium gallinaceum]|uniref:DUF6827 domain-containing protein n=1 Tax=Plasmodium gallinaceum TaxID=5849 RepID=A0A1J1GS90_PLAGA|nr:conserved Plasmodium protein, unknown function [Plasmodium gallinaceum]CRG95172.1 conserved Plasmodium protein, unknown function [Plasmodium gallinaceum]
MRLSSYFLYGKNFLKVFNKENGLICGTFLSNRAKNNEIKKIMLKDKRKYFTSLYNNLNEKKNIIREIDDLYDNIITSNWNDSFNLVLNVSIWEGILNSIEEKIKGYEYDNEVMKKKKEINELFDVLFILEDLRDHINEILEQSSRSSGLAGTHILSSFKIENINEHINFLKKKYEDLLLTYPSYNYQIKLVLGRGLALLRQRYNFEWKYMHEFFF